MNGFCRLLLLEGLLLRCQVFGSVTGHDFESQVEVYQQGFLLTILIVIHAVYQNTLGHPLIFVQFIG